MKKIVSLLLALIMAVGCTLALASCGAEPELDIDVAKTNFSKNDDYIISIDRGDEDDVQEAVRTLYAYSKDGKEELTLSEYLDEELAEYIYNIIYNQAFL